MHELKQKAISELCVKLGVVSNCFKDIFFVGLAIDYADIDNYIEMPTTPDEGVKREIFFVKAEGFYHRKKISFYNRNAAKEKQMKIIEMRTVHNLSMRLSPSNDGFYNAIRKECS